MARTKSGLIVPDDKGILYAPESLSPESFRHAFPKVTNPETGRQVISNTPDWDVLMRSPEIVAGAQRIRQQYDTAVKNPEMLKKGREYYGREHSRLEHIGEQFNTVRAKRGMQTYYEDDPSVAGLLLAGSFSQNNSEANRERLLAQTVATGDIGKHLSTGSINQAIESGEHALDVFAKMGGGEGLKLYDYSGSIYHPGAWHGEWRGVKRGTGHTVDRHQHDMFMGQKMGEFKRPLSSSPVNIRRYRAFQAGHLLAQYGPGGTEETYGFGDSPDTFQAITWGPWRGGYE